MVHTASLRLGLAALLVTSAATACRNDPGPGGTPRGDAGTQPIGDCPGDGITVCALKLPTSSRHPMLDEPVSLAGVVITTPTIALSRDRVSREVLLAGFYVQDPAGASFLDGRYSGILVTYKPAELVGPIPVGAGDGSPIGQVVNIEGTYTEFGPDGFDKQKQLQAARIDSAGAPVAIEPVAIEPPDRIGVGGTDAAAYEGVMVKISEATITESTVMVNGQEVFGAFRVTPTLIVSGQIYEYRNPQVGEQFTSIAGVLRLGTAPFEAGAYFITPRFAADVVSKNAAAEVRSIAGIQDPTSPDRPLESCENPNGNEVIGKCATAKLTRVLVTAAGGYVSTNLRSLFVQDPSDADGRYAGVKIVFNPNQLRVVPSVGTFIDVEGEVIKYRGGVQIQYPTITRNGTETATLTPTLVSNLADLARDQMTTHAYEGSLVRVEGVTVTQRCVEDTSQRDHGYWIVGPNVMIGSAWDYDYNGDIRPAGVMCLDADQNPTGLCSCSAMSRPNDLRTVGDTFASITGVVDYSFGEYRIEPRSADDLVK